MQVCRQKINGMYTKMVRYVLGIKVYSRETRITNAALLKGFPSLEGIILERRLRFAGHCWRSKLLVKKLMFATTSGKKKRGRPMLTYPRMLMRDTDLKITELKDVMAEREKWDELVKDLVKKVSGKQCAPKEKRLGQRWLAVGRGSPSQALLRCA